MVPTTAVSWSTYVGGTYIPLDWYGTTVIASRNVPATFLRPNEKPGGGIVQGEPFPFLIILDLFRRGQERPHRLVPYHIVQRRARRREVTATSLCDFRFISKSSSLETSRNCTMPMDTTVSRSTNETKTVRLATAHPCMSQIVIRGDVRLSRVLAVISTMTYSHLSV